MKEGVTPRHPTGPDRREKRTINLERINLMWGLWTGLYMLEPWEQMRFSAWPGAAQRGAWAAAARARAGGLPTGAESPDAQSSHHARPRLSLPQMASSLCA